MKILPAPCVSNMANDLKWRCDVTRHVTTCLCCLMDARKAATLSFSALILLPDLLDRKLNRCKSRGERIRHRRHPLSTCKGYWHVTPSASTPFPSSSTSVTTYPTSTNASGINRPHPCVLHVIHKILYCRDMSKPSRDKDPVERQACKNKELLYLLD